MSGEKLATLVFVLVILGTGLASAAPSSPVIEEFDVPDSVPVGANINVTLKLAGSFEIYYNGYDVFVHYTIGEGTTESSKKLLYNETSGNWTGTVIVPSYINYTSKVTWKDVQVYAPENRTAIQNKVTQVIGYEEKSSPWEMVFIVVFLGVTFVVVELTFKPMRGKPRGGEPDDENVDEDEKRDTDNQ